MALIFEGKGAAREDPAVLEALCDGPGAGAGSEMVGEVGKRSCRSGTPPSAGMRVASTGGVVGSVGFWAGDLGAGGRIDGRRGFGRRTGGVDCYRQSVRTEACFEFLGNRVLVPLDACSLRGV